MIRRFAAVILALTFNQALLNAQSVVLTVSVASADVYKGPSNVTPVIGHAARGAVLPVSRNLGSWVKVAWPQAQDGIGYVHVTMGRVGPPAPNTAMPSAAAAGAAAPASMPPTATIQPMARTSVGEQVVPRGLLRTTPASHIVGVGGLFGVPGGAGSSFANTVGASARVWSTNRLGVQFGFSRDAITNTALAGRVTSTSFEPGIVYGLFDRVSDYVWVRPYVGSVLSIQRQTLGATAPLVSPSTSDNGLGFRVFGGSELMFASLPRFGVSADLGYRRFPTPFAGFEADRVNVAVAGHWYIK